jgi:Ca-activated chloride channel family protein
VVAFSESGLAIQRPTNEQAEILGAITRIAPQRGTSLGQGIAAALNALEADQRPTRYSTLTQTATPTPQPVPPGTNRAAAIELLTVGIGSAAGTTLKVNGFTVHTQLDEETLQQIAERTAGTYFNAENEEELRSIYENLDLQLVMKSEDTEITALFAGIGLLVLLIGGVCSLMWFGRVP